MILRNESAEGKSAPSPSHHCAACERLTPDESARKFDILEGIMAIPTSELRGCLKPHLQRLMSHCEYGQRSSYASYNTIAKETGVSPGMARKHRVDIIAGAWFVEARRRNSQSKHARAELVPGPRLIEHLRSYFAERDSRKRAKVAQQVNNLSADTEVATRGSNPESINSHLGVATPTDNQVATRGDNQVAPTCGNNPVPVPRTENPASSSPRSAGRGGGGGERSVAERDARRGGKDKDKNAPSTQSRWRDLGVIQPDEWTDEENNAMWMAHCVDEHNGVEGFEAEVRSRWTHLMNASGGRIKLIEEVLLDMSNALDRGKEMPSPMGYLISVLKDRARPKQIASMPPGEKPRQKPAPGSGNAPPSRGPWLYGEGDQVRDMICDRAKKMRQEGKAWEEIFASMDRDLSALPKSYDWMAERREMIKQELDHLRELEWDEAEDESHVRKAIGEAIRKFAGFNGDLDQIRQKIEAGMRSREEEFGLREDVVKLRREWLDSEIERTRAEWEAGAKKTQEMIAEFTSKFGNDKNLRSEHALAPRRRPTAG